MSNPEPAKPAARVSMSRLALVLTIVGTAVLTFVVAYLLVDVFRKKTEAENPYLRLVDVVQATTDPEPWGVNWPREYAAYRRTVDASRTNFGGGDAHPAQKAEISPWLTPAFAGYAFALDYRDRRGHAFMLFDQEHTRRVTERPQAGACLNCHSSVVPTYYRLGGGNIEAGEGFSYDKVEQGFEKLSVMKYWDAHAEVVKTGSYNPVPGGGVKQAFNHVPGAHPVSCTDCHNAKTMQLEINRPAFVRGIQALKASQGVKNFDVNRDATRAEMRTYVCAQCHVEYYCGPKVPMFFPWANGLKVQEIEKYYNDYKFPDGTRFDDWKHAISGAPMLKAQHPEFELWNQGIHAKSGVSCTDCHMPYVREGAMKVSDHYVRSPLLMVNQSCQQCHSAWSEEELKARVATIQNTNFKLLQESGTALVDFLETIKLLRKPFDEQNRAAAEQEAREKLASGEAFQKATPEQQAQKLKEATASALNARWAAYANKQENLKPILELHREGQWRLDFIAAENSMGFHAPQEAARVLAESTNKLRKAQLMTSRLLPADTKIPVTLKTPYITDIRQPVPTPPKVPDAELELPKKVDDTPGRVTRPE